MFFGYDLPDYITEDDILSFLEDYDMSIVSIEVELNQRHGNYAKITFETPDDAYEAMDYYSGQYWDEFDVQVVLKPWKERDRSSQKKKRQHSKDTYYEDDDNFSICSESSQQSMNYSYNTSSHFLLPYPGISESKAGEPIYSEYDVESTESMQKTKKPPRSSGSQYAIKISGLDFDVTEKDILKLVEPFGDLANPVTIASFPENEICYAYADFCTSISAKEAVSKLNKNDFNGVKIHVCHKGKLRVHHSCRKELEKLAEEEHGDVDTSSADGIKHVQGTSILHLLQTAPQQSANKSASDSSIVQMPLNLLNNSAKQSTDDIGNVYLSTHRSDVSCKHSFDKVDAFSKVEAHNLPHIEEQVTEIKSRNESSYASVAKSPPTPVKMLSSKKKADQGVGKKPKSTVTAPENLNVKDGKCQPSIDLTPYIMPTKSLSSKINNLPDVGHTKEQITMASNESVDQSLPECVKFLFEKPRQKPGIHSTVDASLTRSSIKDKLQIFTESSSSSPNPPLNISPYKQTYEDTTGHSFVTRSSPQVVKVIQEVRALQQQPKHDLNAVKSNCILEVTNLHPDACVQDLDRYFKPYGDLKAPISIRLDPTTDSCYAIVHYVSPDAAQKAMIGLCGCDISGYQMHIVNPNCNVADTKVATSTNPVIPDPVTVYDSAVVSSSNLHVKAMENNTTSSAQ